MAKPLRSTGIWESKKLFPLVLVGLAILKIGIWIIPNTSNSFQIALNPFKKPELGVSGEYIFHSWLATFASWLLQIRSIKLFILLHFIFAIIAMVNLFLLSRRSKTQINRNYIFFLFVSLPATGEIFYWVGMDSATLFLMTLVLLFQKRSRVLIASVLLGMQHFEIGATSIISLMVWHFSCQIMGRTSEVVPKNKFYTTVIGLVTGKFLLELTFSINNISIPNNRISIAAENWHYNLLHNLGNLPLAVWTMYGSLWIILILQLDPLEIVPLFIASLVPITVGLFVADQSRIMQLTSFMLISQSFILNQKSLSQIDLAKFKRYFAIWVVTPWIWVYVTIRGSVTIYDVKVLLDNLFGSDFSPNLGELANWPFR